MQILKQSTASQIVVVGPFVDDTDFKTAETALSIANTDLKLSKAGGAQASKNSGGGTHLGLGDYAITLDATDTNTVGGLRVTCKMAGALVVWRDFQVVEEAVYDALLAASAAGYQVPIWAAAGSTVNLSATTIKTLTDAPADLSGTTSLLARLTSTRAGYLDNLSAGAVALASTFTGITSLAQWLGLIAGKQTGNSTARTELRATGAGSGTFDETTDSQEALRDRGDAAWLTVTAAAIRAAVGLASANLDTQLAAIDDFIDTEVAAILAAVDTEVAAILAIVNRLDTALEADGGVYRFTANALEQAPSGTGASAQSIVEAMFQNDSGETAASAVAGSAVYEIVLNAGGGSAPSASAIADEVQTRTIAAVTVVNGLANGVITANSIAANAFAAAKFAAGAFDAVWSVAARVLTAGTNIALAKGTGITGFTDLDASGVRAAVGLASANLDTQLGTIDDFLDTEVAAILAAVDTEVAAIKLKTDALPASPAATGDAMTLTSGERNATADAFLNRNVAGGSSTGRTVKEALYRLRNRVAIAAGTATVYGTDDSSAAWTAAVSTAAGNPVSEVDPT